MSTPSPKALTLEKCWEDFKVQAIPESAPPEQIEAMHQAFLAGCVTLCQVYKAARQHSPANVHTIMQQWFDTVQQRFLASAIDTTVGKPS